eukprot:GFUD01044545.1.p1 GENE.GFUD01044545.1~~GFUD01044545.1.p1  ORF type:complete len:194 (+),score=37.61 GFUD01044545.1:65-646(+)
MENQIFVSRTMVNPEVMSVIRDPDYDDRKSPSDIYRFNGEDIKPKSDDGKIDDNILLQLFKEQDMASGQHGGASQNKFSKLEPQLLSQNSHAHPYKPEGSWIEMNHRSKMEIYPLAPPTPFGGRGNNYAGGPNITPSYHNISGELLESNRSDSSSNSGADSSPTQSHSSRYETSNPCGVLIILTPSKPFKTPG